MVFHWSLSDSKSPQVSKTLLCILADLNHAVVWMLSAHPLISNSSSPLIKPLGIDPSTPTTIGIAVTFIFHSIFSSLARSKYLSLFSFSLIFTLWSAGMAKSTIRLVLFIFNYHFWPGLGDLFVPLTTREFCGSHSPGEILV